MLVLRRRYISRGISSLDSGSPFSSLVAGWLVFLLIFQVGRKSKKVAGEQNYFCLIYFSLSSGFVSKFPGLKLIVAGGIPWSQPLVTAMRLVLLHCVVG